MSNKALAFYDFSGGINTSSTKVILGYGAKKLFWDDSYNVELYKNQGVQRQNGNQSFYQDNEPIVAIYNYPVSTKHFVYLTQSGKVKFFDSDANISRVVYDYQKDINKADFALFLDGIAIAANDSLAIYLNINSSNEVSEINLTTPDGRVIHPDAMCSYASRLWLASGSTVYFSALGRFDDFESENDAGYIANFHSSTTKISAMSLYCSNLAFFKEDGVYLLSGTSPNNFAISKFADKGVLGSKTICTCNNKQYFLNSDGLFALSQVGELSQIMMSGNIASDIQEEFSLIDKTRMQHAFCVPYEKKNQIWFYVPNNEGPYYNIIFIYDFLNDCWMKRVQKNQKISCATNVFSNLYSATYDGKILMENIGNTFDGEIIDFKFSTPFLHLGKPSERKIIEDFALLLDETGQTSFYFSTTKDYIDEIRSDMDYIKSGDLNSLVWAKENEQENEYNCFEASNDAIWAMSFENIIPLQIFDSNICVALHIEGKEKNDNFKLIGIEFKEMINDY